MRVKHRVMRVEIRGPNEGALILEDGSKLVGLSGLSAEIVEPSGISKWSACGYVDPDISKERDSE